GVDGGGETFDSLRVERVSVELMKGRYSGDHQTAPPSESRLAQRMTGQSDRASSAPPLRKGRHDRRYRYCRALRNVPLLLMSWKQTPAPIRITFWVALVVGIAAITLAILLLVAVSNFSPLGSATAN